MKYKQGDILTDGNGERKVLGVCGEVYLISAWGDFSSFGWVWTKEELDESGYHPKGSPTEMTLSEVAKQLGIDNLKIVKG